MSDEERLGASVDGEPGKLPSLPAADSLPAEAPRTYVVDGRRLPAHPAAELFPLVDPDAEPEHLADIKTNGQREPIILNADGTRVVDGRNRCILCEKAEIPVRFRKLPLDADEIGIITSANLHRRHLNTAQRSLIAVELATLRRGGDAGKPKATRKGLAAAPPLPLDSTGNSGEMSAPKSKNGDSEAVVRGKGRPVGGEHPQETDRTPRGKSRKSSAQGPQRPDERANRQSERLVSQADAAKQMEVSVATLRKAKAVRGDPILNAALKAGTISVDAAYKVRDADDETKKRVVSGERAAARAVTDIGGDWTAPDWIVTIGRQLLDQRIDLDPASSLEAQETIKAKRFITPGEDALKPETSWGEPNASLHVWLHPPTGEATSLFVTRLFEEFKKGTVGLACWFGPAAFEATWYRRLLRKSRAFVTFNEPVRKGASQSYVMVCFRIEPMQVHEVVGDRGLVNTVFQPRESVSAASRTAAQAAVAKVPHKSLPATAKK